MASDFYDITESGGTGYPYDEEHQYTTGPECCSPENGYMPAEESDDGVDYDEQG